MFIYVSILSSGPFSINYCTFKEVCVLVMKLKILQL